MRGALALLCAAAAARAWECAGPDAAVRGARRGNASRIPRRFVRRAEELMRQHPLIDGHNDLPWALRRMVANQVLNVDLNSTVPGLQTDIPRMREGLMGGNFWSVYTSCGSQGKDAVRQTMEQIDVVKKLAARYPETFGLCTTAAGCEAVFAEGKIISLMGIEGAHQVDSSMAALRFFHAAGVRYMTLTHSCSTPAFTSCGSGTNGPNNVGCDADDDCRPGSCVSGTCAEAQTGGVVAEFGAEMIREMNRLGMFVDVSHVSPQTQLDALMLSTAPAIYSHSNARALCDHPRNAPDEALLRLKENGGVIMVVALGSFVCGPPGQSATLDHVVDHIDYIAHGTCPSYAPDCNPSGFPGIGAEHIGIGADFDGGGGVPGLDQVSEYPNFVAELLQRGYSDSAVIGIMGGNVLRAMRGMEAESARLAGHFPDEKMLYPARQCRSTN